MQNEMSLDQKEFEKKCIEVIEQVVLLDINQTRLGAVDVSKKMLDKARNQCLEIAEKAKQAPKDTVRTMLEKAKKIKLVVDIYKKVYEEFCSCSDQEYAILKKQLFSKK